MKKNISAWIAFFVVFCACHSYATVTTNLPTTVSGGAGVVSALQTNDTVTYTVAKDNLVTIGGFSWVGGAVTSVVRSRGHRSIFARKMTRSTSESQAAKRIETRLKREKELSTEYRKTLKILGENEAWFQFVEGGSMNPCQFGGRGVKIMISGEIRKRDLEALEKRRRAGMALLAKGVFQAEVARIVGVSRMTVMRWELLRKEKTRAAWKRRRLGRPPKRTRTYPCGLGVIDPYSLAN